MNILFSTVNMPGVSSRVEAGAPGGDTIMGITKGATARFSAFIRLSGVLTDPTTLVLSVTSPSSVVTNYSIAGATLTVDGVGMYHRDVVLNESGTWNFTWTAGGTVVASSAGTAVVDPAKETVTIHTRSSIDSTALAGVSIHGYVGGTLEFGGVTPSSGNLVFQLLPGTYVVELNKDKVSFPSNAARITVIDTGGVTPQTFNINGTPQTIADNAGMNRVKLFGYVTGPTGAPLEARVTVATVALGNNRPYVAGSSPATGIAADDLLVVPGTMELRSDPDTGYWEVDVPAGSTVRVLILQARFDKIFRVPTDGTATLNVRDAREDPGQNETGILTDNALAPTFKTSNG